MLIAHGNGMMIIKTEDSRNTETGIMPLQKQQLSLIGLCYFAMYIHARWRTHALSAGVLRFPPSIFGVCVLHRTGYCYIIAHSTLSVDSCLSGQGNLRENSLPVYGHDGGCLFDVSYPG